MREPRPALVQHGADVQLPSGLAPRVCGSSLRPGTVSNALEFIYRATRSDEYAVLIVKLLGGRIQDVNDVEEMSRTRKSNASKPDAVEQLLGIRMSGRIEERAGLVDFNHPASLHYRDFVAVMSGNAKIGGYDQLCRPSFAR